MKKNSSLFILIIFLSITLGFLIGSNKNFLTNNSYFSKNNLSKFNLLINYLSNNYVDQINVDSIVGNSIQDIIKNLDPHSNYISKQELDLISDRMKGNFVGIGVSFLMVGDTSISKDQFFNSSIVSSKICSTSFMATLLRSIIPEVCSSI